MSAARWEIERAVRSSGLPYPARLVVLMLLTRADAATAVVPLAHSPSLATLAADTGLGRSTVARHLAIVEEAGWVTRHRSVRAAEEQAPNWYEVHLPARRTAGLGPERDQGARPRAGPEQVPERRKPSPRTGHNQTNRPVPDQPSGAEAPAPSAELALGLPGADPNTQHVLAGFIDFDRANGGQLTRRTIGQLARHIHDMLTEGIPPDRIRQGLAAWRDRGQHPSTLHSFVDAIRPGPPPPPMSSRPAERNAMFDRAMARAQARDGARERGGLP
jgi:hypothetical protein